MIRENFGEALDYPNVIKRSGVLGCFHISNSTLLCSEYHLSLVKVSHFTFFSGLFFHLMAVIYFANGIQYTMSIEWLFVHSVLLEVLSAI